MYKRQAQRGDEPPLELGRLMVGQGVQISAGAVGSVAGRTLEAGTVTGILHGFEDGRLAGRALHAHGAVSYTHLDVYKRQPNA